MRIAPTFLVLASLAGRAAASEVISFEEIPAQNDRSATLSEEYAHLGVHFIGTDDGGIWDGISNGDPGVWGLEGTNGPSFIAFGGSSYRLAARFDTPVPAFHLDVSAASGVGSGATFTLQGYRSGAMVETASVTLAAVNQWMTVALSTEVDEVVMVGGGFRPKFGADNMGWGIDAAPRIDALIDVKPGNAENPVNPGSNGLLQVALLGSESLDVMNVDPSSLELGVDAAPILKFEYVDANDDGWMDLVGHYSTLATGTAYGDTSICLTGATQDGVELAGCDAIRTVPQTPAAEKARRR